jgi:FKBP-type peptidyl-prolyl cis-trans isomerase
VFDASEKHGKPFSFVVGIGQVIRGWDMGIMEMTKGEKARLFISPEFGYGDAGAGSIPVSTRARARARPRD